MPQILVALAMIVMGPPEQPRPDFSGEWILERLGAGPEVPRALSVQHTFTRPPTPTVAFLEHLRVEREFEGECRTAEYRIGVSGGIVGGVVPGAGQPATRTHSVRWEGDRLVIQTGAYSGPPSDPGPYTEREEVWSLDADGHLAIEITERASGKDDTSTTLRYRRR